MNRLYTAAAAAAVILLLSLPVASHADRGMMTISADPDIVLSEGVQRALIAFNGTEEILVLATEVTASTPAKVLEFIPLPSVPTIREAPPEVFDRAMFLIARHAPAISKGTGKRDGGDTHGQPPDIEVVSKTVIGPHSLTVVKVQNAEHFVQWITDFFNNEGIDAGPAKAAHMKDVVGDYLDRGFTYFVFDVVSVGPDATGIAPLLYRFRTDYLYYPLEISSRIPGATRIDLFLVTPGTPKKAALPDGFTIADYVFPKNPFTGEKGAPSVPISVSLDMADRVTLSPAVAAMLPGWNTKTRLTVIRYDGPAADLFGDLVLDRADFRDADFRSVENALGERKVVAEYAPAGTVDLAVTPVAGSPAPAASADGSHIYYLPGMFYSVRKVELMASYSAPAAADGDPSTPFVLESGMSWSIDLGRSREIVTVDILAAVPIPDKDTTFTYGIRLAASDTGKFSGEEKMVGSGIIESYTETDDTHDVSGRASLVRLTDKPIRARYLKIEYVPYGAYNDMYLFEVMPWGKQEEAP
ncbi:MAG: DUF2330 domain-containing protein [Deltaproteobacteria bacterium]|nr:DUF2330 domain-containing protein [Candidatus Zymogenaceae bacterium]